MTKPITELDTRYSDQNAVATSWDDTRQALEDAQLFWICTVRPDGRPHLTPLVSVWHEGSLYFCTGTTEQKFANLQSNDQVLLLTGSNAWNEGLDVVLEGQAVQVTDEALLRRLAQAWAAKWDGRWQLTVGDGTFGSGDSASHVYSVRPTKIFAHAKGDPFGQTRHTCS